MVYTSLPASVLNLKLQFPNSKSQINQKISAEGQRNHLSQISHTSQGSQTCYCMTYMTPMTSLTQIALTISLKIAAKLGSACLAACKTSS